MMTRRLRPPVGSGIMDMPVPVSMAKMRMAPVTIQSWKEGTMREMLLAGPVGRRDYRAIRRAELFCLHEKPTGAGGWECKFVFCSSSFSTWFKACIVETLLCLDETLHWSQNDAAWVVA